MSLIVARKFDENIVILSDTKLTFDPCKLNNIPHEIHRACVDRNLLKDGAIKSIILSPNIAICFAGGVLHAEAALTEIAGDLDIDHIEKVLLKHHENSNRETDFILAYSGDTAVIKEVKDGMLQIKDNTWIGSIDGFNHYQREFLSLRQNTGGSYPLCSFEFIQLPEHYEDSLKSTYCQMFKAMKEVINGHEVQEVGGFTVPLTLENKKFQYRLYLQIYRKPIEVDDAALVNFGNAQEGSYIVNFSGGETSQLAVHLPFGDIGVFYDRHENGLMIPHVHREMDEISFSEFLEANTDITLGAKVQSGELHFALKSQKALEQRQYGVAIERANQAVAIASRLWGPEPKQDNCFSSLQECIDAKGAVQIPEKSLADLNKILILKGRALAAANDHQSAIFSYKEALSIDGDCFDSLYLQGVSQCEIGDYDEAIKLFSKCIVLQNSEHPYYSRGLAYFSKGELEHARSDFEQCLALNGENLQCRRALLRLLQHQNK